MARLCGSLLTLLHCVQHGVPDVGWLYGRNAVGMIKGVQHGRSYACSLHNGCCSLGGLAGRVVLHDGGDAGEVEAPRRHVGAQQHAAAAAGELQEGGGALRLHACTEGCRPGFEIVLQAPAAAISLKQQQQAQQQLMCLREARAS